MTDNQLPPTAKARIEAINDEVGELHPLLERLFHTMPFNRVENTHGTNEMGADFVLTTTHNFLHTEEYIGVVAKTKKILQNTEDIERQIDECRVKRFIEGGRKEVRLSQVWVVTTKTISDNAKRKINEKFAGTNVQFIDVDHLTKLVHEHMPDFWYNIPIDVGAYLADVRRHNEASDKSFSLLPAENLGYIKQDVVRVEEEYYGGRGRRGPRKTEHVDLHTEIAQQRFMFVEGGVGSGKSKLLRKVVDRYTDPEIFKHERILPLPLTFREFHDQHDHSIAKAMEARLSGQVSPTVLKDATVLLLIDGFDEKILTYEERLEVLESFKKELDGMQSVRAVITSRYLFSVVSPPNALKQASRYEVSQLSFKKILEFIEKICKQVNVKSRLLEDLKKSPLMRDLPKSPIAAILLGQILQENGQDLPSNLTELYSKYVELVLGRWETQKGLQSQRDYEVLENVLMEVAVFMIDHELNTISCDDLRRLIREYCERRNLGISTEEIYNLLRERNEILVVHEAGNQVAFKHRSFAEFLYGKHLIRSQKYEPTRQAFNVYWSTIHFFALGILKDAPVQLRQLGQIEPGNEAERFLKAMNLGNFALAAYATPTDVIIETVQTAAQEIATVYTKVTRGKDPLLNNLPQMALLYIMQMMFRDAYGFDFLRPALEEAAVNLAGERSDRLPYELFFLNVAYVDVNKEGSFKMLLDATDCKVPADLMLAVMNETKNDRKKADVTPDSVKRNNKLAARMLADESTRQSLSLLFTMPMKNRKVLSGTSPAKKNYKPKKDFRKIVR